MAKKQQRFETAFDTYTQTGVLGEGGSGRVYAVDNASGAPFALKCLSPNLVSEEKLKRFRNEIEFCQRTIHPNIIHIVDTGWVEIDGAKYPFYVMDRFAETLRKRMKEGIETADVLPLFAQILDGVEAAHLLDTWHRDLKPENILWGPSQKRLVVADFGIAHFEEDEIYTAVETQIASRMANFRYAAPEQRDRTRSVDSRADIYALGLILSEMLTGDVPQGAGYTKIAEVVEDLSYLDDLIDEMIQHNPDNRPQTIGIVKEQLIGRSNVFVSEQQLNELKNTVVPKGSASEFTPIKLINFDYQNGTMILELDQAPPPGWREEFENPRGGHGSILGHGPETYQFRGKTAIQANVRENEKTIQQLIDYFKQYLSAANKNYQLQLSEQAEREERARRAQLEKEIKDAEMRANILKKIKI